MPTDPPELTEAELSTRGKSLRRLRCQLGATTRNANFLAAHRIGRTLLAQCDELLSSLADMTKRAKKAEAGLAFMVERAADQKLDGYRELGQRAADAERELREIKTTTLQYYIDKAIASDRWSRTETEMRKEAERERDELKARVAELKSIARQGWTSARLLAISGSPYGAPRTEAAADKALAEIGE